MTFKRRDVFPCAAAWALLVALAVPFSFAEDDVDESSAASDVDAELQGEIDYVEALVNSGFPDFAAPVIEATKKRWPESDAMFFAIEIRGLLSMNRFDEAQAKIAALPDRNSSKYWAARLEVANNFFARGNKKECSVIYDEFFKKYSNPPKELLKFYQNACYAWGQILFADKRIEEAADVYSKLLSKIAVKDEDSDKEWCSVACETAEMYLHLAEGAPIGNRKKYLAAAEKIIKSLLWKRNFYLVFGRAVAMKAHYNVLNGRIDLAQNVINDYMNELSAIHGELLKLDPDGRQGHLRMSPMPQCRYLLADMLWKEVQAELKKPKRDDERIKALMFGEKLKSGKRNKAGAYNHALNVFVNFPMSSWASQAGELSEEIREFAEKTYGAKIKSNVTPEQIRKIREMEFKNAGQLFSDGQYTEAIAAYLQALGRYPEGIASVAAIEKTAMIYLNLIGRSGDANEKESLRIDADAIEGYLAERFAGAADKAVMTAAGDAVLRLAAVEKERKNLAQADRLYRAFILTYRRHLNAPLTAAALAGESQKEEDFERALELWQVIVTLYPNAKDFYTLALTQSAVCYEKLGDRARAIESLKTFCSVENNPLKKTQGQMNLAMLYQKDGLDLLEGAETNAVPEEATKQLVEGTKQILRGIQQFQDFAKRADEKLADAGVSEGDKKQYSMLREAALYLVGDCWGRMKKPDDKVEMYRGRAVKALEEYVAAYPKGKYAKAAYVKLGAYYMVDGDVEKSRDALARLQKLFPDSVEAKNAKPRLAKALLEMGRRKEGTDIYAEMLRLDGAYTAQQFLNAGEALVAARNWDLASQAFDRAIAKAATNQITTVARARLGRAKSYYAQKSYLEARDALDSFFEYLESKKRTGASLAADANLLLVDVASEQARSERDDKLRRKYSGEAIAAVKKLRFYWAKRPAYERDRIDLMSADVTINRMQGEDAMGLEEQATRSCERAAGALQSFYQAHAPTAEHPLEAFAAGERANLERCYAKMIPLFARLGGDRYEFVLRYGEEYLRYFPNGAARTEVINCLNQAKAAGAKLTEASADAPAPAAAPAGEAASDEDAEEGAEEPADETPPAGEPEPEDELNEDEEESEGETSNE